MLSGWVQVAFERELAGDITPVTVGDVPLVLVHAGDRVRAASAVCPHRGAHLGFGGRVDGEVIVCPFHGHRIHVGHARDDRFCVPEFPAIGYGGMVFVRLGDAHENGLTAFLDRLADGHVFVPGFELHVDARPELVIENAFDASHFAPVHGMPDEPKFSVRDGENGAFRVEGAFRLPRSTWHRVEEELADVHFVARAFSPNLVISELRGEFPYTVITAATPAPGGGSIVRLSLAVPASNGARPDPELCRYLLDRSREGIEADAEVWAHMIGVRHPAYTSADAAVVAFGEFCDRFAR